MWESGKLTSEDREELKDIFLRTIDGGYQIYGDNLFKPFNLKLNKWMTKAYKAYYDAVMVGLSNHLDDIDTLIARKTTVIEATKELLRADKDKLFTGGGKSKADIKKRIQLFDDMLTQVIKG